MDIEGKKKYLSGYQENKRAARRLEEEMEELNEAAVGIEHKVQQNLMESVIRERYRRIEKFVEIRNKIEGMENEKEKDALMYRHIKGYTEERAAECMGYTKRQFQRIYKRAVEHLEV